MHSFARRLVLTLSLLGSAFAAHAQVVISQVYGGGGNTGAPYNRDFIELHNNGTTSVSLGGWTVQYASSTGTTWAITALNGSIPAGGYYLVHQAAGAIGAPLPAADATGTLAMSATNGKVALVNAPIALTGACPTGTADFVGYGSANCAEASAPTGALSATTAAIRANSGCTDTNNNNADFAVVAPSPRNSTSTSFACGGGNPPALTILDRAVLEGDSGPNTIFLTVQLDQPAGPDGVTFQWATADGTATAGSDYSAQSGSDTISAGGTSTTIGVSSWTDTENEPDEYFFVNITTVVNATIADGQAIITLVTDDVTITPIHAIQGSGSTSPLIGQTVTTRGIVTGRKNNGFFIQTDQTDSDPQTSEGVFVFTGTTPPSAAAYRSLVQVSGTVVEFVPAADPGQLPFTEIGGAVSVYELARLITLPAPISLTLTFPDPANPALDQLEQVEGMRVTAASFTVVAPTRGSTNETDATGSSNGQFNLVVTGVARPLREPGIQNPDPAPGGGSIPPIPRWDFNPELLFSDSDGIGGPRLDLAAGSTLTNYVGPMDYGFRRYSIYPDPLDVTPVIVQPAVTAARLPSAGEFTVASYNLERFFDTIADPVTDDPVLTPAAYANRLNKASLGIRNFLNTPDILGLVEVEKLPVLQDLANKIGTDAIAAGQPDPQYVPYLQEGNDIGGIDVGFLVKSAEVAAGIDRIQVVAVTQLGKDTILTNPDGSTALLNDRPPLQLDAMVYYANGRKFPITVIVVHQRSLSGAEGNDANGVRVRNKRQKQAEYLAGIVQAMQIAEPERNITLIGDFNAFEFNDGLVNPMAVVSGTPFADNTTVVPGDGADLVATDLLNLASEESPDQRYSFVFGGNAQSLDHVLINQALGAAVSGFSLDHARVNADFPEINRNDANSASRLSDHDPAVAYFAVISADLAVSASATPASVAVNDTMTFNVTLTNTGLDDAQFPGVGFVADAELADLVVTGPNGWMCDPPEVSDGMTSTACFAATIAVGETAVFTVRGSAPVSRAGTAIRLVAKVVSDATDPNSGNNQAQADVWVRGSTSINCMGPSAVFKAECAGTFLRAYKSDR